MNATAFRQSFAIGDGSMMAQAFCLSDRTADACCPHRGYVHENCDNPCNCLQECEPLRMTVLLEIPILLKAAVMVSAAGVGPPVESLRGL